MSQYEGAIKKYFSTKGGDRTLLATPIRDDVMTEIGIKKGHQTKFKNMLGLYQPKTRATKHNIGEELDDLLALPGIMASLESHNHNIPIDTEEKKLVGVFCLSMRNMLTEDIHINLTRKIEFNQGEVFAEGQTMEEGQLKKLFHMVSRM
jgi:hypothetical protein